MKAKRRVCALLFSALMIWQGFMIVNAEGALDAGVNGGEEPGTKNTTATLASDVTVGNDTTTGRAAPGVASAAASVAPGNTAEAGAVQSQRQGTPVYGIIQDANIYLDGNNPVDPVKDGQEIIRTQLLKIKAKLNFDKTTLHAAD